MDFIIATKKSPELKPWFPETIYWGVVSPHFLTEYWLFHYIEGITLRQ